MAERRMLSELLSIPLTHYTESVAGWKESDQSSAAPSATSSFLGVSVRAKWTATETGFRNLRLLLCPHILTPA